MKRYKMSLDEEVNQHLEGILKNLKELGIKNASKADALRYVIKLNKATNVKARRKRNTKPRVKDGLEFF